MTTRPPSWQSSRHAPGQATDPLRRSPTPSPQPLAPIFGRHPVLEALRAGRTIHRIWLAQGLKPSFEIDEIQRTADAANIPTTVVAKAELDDLSNGGNHQGVAAACVPRQTASVESLLDIAASRRQAPLLVGVDHLEDPQNLGSLLRTAEAAGVHGVILPRRRSVGITPTVVRVSAGAAEHLAIAHVVNLPRTLEQLKQRGLWIAGLDADAPLRYDRADLTLPLVVVVGAEGRGISRLAASYCDLLVRIPMAGQVASLNAAVAAAIMLFETVRQRA